MGVPGGGMGAVNGRQDQLTYVDFFLAPEPEFFDVPRALTAPTVLFFFVFFSLVMHTHALYVIRTSCRCMLHFPIYYVLPYAVY